MIKQTTKRYFPEHTCRDFSNCYKIDYNNVKVVVFNNLVVYKDPQIGEMMLHDYTTEFDLFHLVTVPALKVNTPSHSVTYKVVEKKMKAFGSTHF